MKDFEGTCENENFFVGCTGGTVYVYNHSMEEIAKFRDMYHGYTAMFKPNSNILVVKALTGQLAIYDLDKMKLKKILKAGFSNNEGFTFSLNGDLLYNIERRAQGLKNVITVYETKNFTVMKELFHDNQDMLFQYLEIDKETNTCYILGIKYDIKEEIRDYFFIGKLYNDSINDVKRINDFVYQQLYMCKYEELRGFSKIIDEDYEKSDTLKCENISKLQQAYERNFGVYDEEECERERKEEFDKSYKLLIKQIFGNK